MTRRHPTQTQRGFTLLEIVLVIVLLGILSMASMNMISGSYTSTRIINNGNANTSTARYAMERISRDMRQVTFDSVAKTLLITTASPTQMSFIKSDFLTQETVTVHLNGTSLMLSNSALPGPDSLLAEHVSAFSLQYFDTNMVTPPANNGVIRFVQINLTLTDTGNADPVTLHTLVALRNT